MDTDVATDRPRLGPRDALLELGRIPSDDASMAMLQRVAELAKQVIPGVAEASITLIANDKASTVAFPGPLSRDLDESLYRRRYGPCLEAAVGEEVREIPDAREEPRWPDYARTAVERGSLSSLSAPLPVREALQGGLNLSAVAADAFDDHAGALATTYASYAAVAVHNLHLYESTRQQAEDLHIAMRTRAVIDQARGILVSQRRCDATQAFNLLAEASRRSNRRLRDIARSVVDGVSEGTGRDDRACPPGRWDRPVAARNGAGAGPGGAQSRDRG